MAFRRDTHHHRSRLGRGAIATLALTLAVGTAAPLAANAAPAYDRSVSYDDFMSHEVLMGAFFTSDGDHSDTLYLSTDGKRFDELGVAYKDASPTNPNDDTSTLGPIHHPLGDPSIMYHDGAFWMLSGWNRHDGKFWPMIGVSKDGKTWSFPEGLKFGGKKYPGIALSPGARYGTDIVAPEWFRDNNGQVYIMFSAGYFGLFHGRPYQDKMVPYLVKVNELHYDGPFEYNERLPKITFRPGRAQQINFPLPSIDRIDGSAFHDDDGSYYITIKRDGAHNEIWRNNHMGTGGWQLVNRNAVEGSEGPSLTKLNGHYYLFTDKLHTWGKDSSRGTLVAEASSLNGKWAGRGKIATLRKDGSRRANRHGTVIRITDKSAKNKLYTLWTGKPVPVRTHNTVNFWGWVKSLLKKTSTSTPTKPAPNKYRG